MASNIKVVLEVDNKRYIADVKQAETATRSFAQSATQNVGSVGSTFAALGTKLDGFAAKLAGIGFAAITANAVKFADSIKEISDATGIAIENVLGFSNAVALNGGSAEAAQKAILKLTASIDEAASGSREMQNAFATANVSLKDLGNLSEQDLLAKTIEGLSKIQNASERVATAQKLLGKEFRSVNLDGVAQGYASATSEAIKYTESIKRSADLQDKLDQAFQKLQLSILKVIEPLAKFVNGLSEEQIDKMVDAVVGLGTAFTALAAAGPVLRAIGTALAGVGTAFAAIKLQGAIAAGSLATIGAGLASLSKTAAIAYSYISAFARGTPMFAKDIPLVTRLSTLFGKLIERLGYFGAGLGGVLAGISGIFGAFVRLLPVIGQVIAALFVLDGALSLFTGKGLVDSIKGWGDSVEEFVTAKFPKLASAINWLNDKMGLGPTVETRKTEDNTELTRLKKRAEMAQQAREEENKAASDEQNNRRQIKTDLDKFIASQREQIISYEQASNAALRQLGYEQALVGIGGAQAASQRAANAAVEERIKLVEQLEGQIRQLQVEEADDKTGVTSAKIGQLRKTIQAVTADGEKYKNQIVGATQALQAAESIERSRIDAAKQLNDLENIRASLLGYTLSQLEQVNQAERAGEFKDRALAEIDALKQQAAARDSLTQQLTVQNTIRQTSAKLIDLETSILGRQFTEVQKLEQLRAQNPEAFERKTQAERDALLQQAQALDEATTKFKAFAFARDLMRDSRDFAQGLKDQMSLEQAMGESTRRRIQVEIDGRRMIQTETDKILDKYGEESQLSDEIRAKRDAEIASAIEGINRLTTAKKASVTEDQAIRDSFSFGWEQAYKKYAEDANSAANQAQTYFNTFTKGFEDAIVKFVQTGKLSFKDLANSIIADFARIAAKKMATSLFDGIGGGGGGGLFGGLLGGIGKIFGFANGGNPAIGKPSIVGENGPELFIPRNAGSVIPNGAIGNTTNTAVTYNIQAVDAASFQQLVARDPKFLHAVVEKGRRSIPQGAMR